MLSSRRLMPPIKFIDSPVDLGPCPLAPLSPIRAPGGRPWPGLIIEETPKRSWSWARSQSSHYWETIQTFQILSRVGQARAGRSNILLHMRSDMEIAEAEAKKSTPNSLS